VYGGDAGAISKQDLRRFLDWAGEHLGYPCLHEVNQAAPTAELEPIREGVAPQTDEQDMGMTYEELSIYGRLRKLSRCGPVSMFRRLLVLWKDRLKIPSNRCRRCSCQSCPQKSFDLPIFVEGRPFRKILVPLW
jgi:NH3-dependent NAD+ synthetase